MFAEIIRESKITARSITYVLFLVILTMVFFIQYRADVIHDLKLADKGILFEEARWGGSHNILMVEPAPGQSDYGSVDAEIPEQVMRNVAYRLFRDISNNRFDTYLFGVIPVHKSLKAEDRRKAQDIFQSITGQSVYDIDAEFSRMDLAKTMETKSMTEQQARDYLKKGYYKKLSYEFDPSHHVKPLYPYEDYMPVREGLTYQEFKRNVGELKKIIGRKTADYENLTAYGAQPRTYEEAKVQYETFIKKDKVSRAYAKLFFSCLKRVMGLAPLFIAVDSVLGCSRRALRGKKALNLAGQSDRKLRAMFLSTAAMVFLPVIIMALAATKELASGIRSLGLHMDYFAFFRYSFLWLLPIGVLSTAAGLFLSLLMKRHLGIE
jgi:hypothetical protein